VTTDQFQTSHALHTVILGDALFLPLSCTSSLDLGSSGVFDFPLATNEYLRQFGFIFGGGRSGVQGLQALQVSYTYFSSFSIHYAYGSVAEGQDFWAEKGMDSIARWNFQ
jgi:hypothetical protein